MQQHNVFFFSSTTIWEERQIVKSFNQCFGSSIRIFFPKTWLKKCCTVQEEKHCTDTKQISTTIPQSMYQDLGLSFQTFFTWFFCLQIITSLWFNTAPSSSALFPSWKSTPRPWYLGGYVRLEIWPVEREHCISTHIYIYIYIYFFFNVQVGELHSLKLRCSPLKNDGVQARNLFFRRVIFRGELLVLGG